MAPTKTSTPRPPQAAAVTVSAGCPRGAEGMSFLMDLDEVPVLDGQLASVYQHLPAVCFAAAEHIADGFVEHTLFFQPHDHCSTPSKVARRRLRVLPMLLLEVRCVHHPLAANALAPEHARSVPPL